MESRMLVEYKGNYFIVEESQDYFVVTVEDECHVFNDYASVNEFIQYYRG